METTKALVPKKPESIVEFTTFGSDAKVKLTIGIVQEQIAKRTKQGHTCTVQDAIRFMALCQARALNPFEGDAYLIGFDSKDGPQFNIIASEQSFLKRAEASAEYDGMQSGVIIRTVDGDIRDIEGTFFSDGEVVVGGWAAIYFKTKKYPQKERVRIEPYKNRVGAGPLWETNTERMIQKVAEAAALRKAFPTKLGGLYTEGEVQTHEDRFRAAKPAVATKEETFLPPSPVEQEPELLPPPPARAPVNAKEELIIFLEVNGVGPAQFLNWYGQSGITPDCDAISDVNEIPVEVCAKLLKAKTGMLQGIKEMEK